jgi:hypothetical protein
VRLLKALRLRLINSTIIVTEATGDDDVPGDVLKLLGEGGMKMTKLIKSKELHRSYNNCLREATSYKMQQPSHNQPYRTYSKDSSNDT